MIQSAHDKRVKERERANGREKRVRKKETNKQRERDVHGKQKARKNNKKLKPTGWTLVTRQQWNRSYHLSF